MRSSLFRLLLFLFFTIPLLEAYLLVAVGGLIGVVPTIALVVLTAVIGAWLLRLEGWRTWIKLQQAIACGELPARELVEGALLLVGGALLLTPGFLTDTFGFLCLLPLSCERLADGIVRYLVRRMQVKTSTTIEGEFRRFDN